ncbi:hypothetical protein COO60DRAFT_945690 [Scenedesmus sp. NREL 46B-D3]|nr:hypothetical protein COO60DRAFT_945690 [Scenedesmus sp. NREL 46B-D3]
MQAALCPGACASPSEVLGMWFLYCQRLMCTQWYLLPLPPDQWPNAWATSRRRYPGPMPGLQAGAASTPALPPPMSAFVVAAESGATQPESDLCFGPLRSWRCVIPARRQLQRRCPAPRPTTSRPAGPPTNTNRYHGGPVLHRRVHPAAINTSIQSAAGPQCHINEFVGHPVYASAGSVMQLSGSKVQPCHRLHCALVGRVLIIMYLVPQQPFACNQRRCSPSVMH